MLTFLKKEKFNGYGHHRGRRKARFELKNND